MPLHDPRSLQEPELLHETERTRVTRLVSGSGGVIRKEPLGPGASHRLHRERSTLATLSGLEGIAQLAEGAPSAPGSLLLVDVGGVALSELPTPLDPAELIALAVRLARAVAGMHGRGVVHRDINPANVIVAGDVPYLIDFGLATTAAATKPSLARFDDIVGTLPYLAPELTGRTGRPVDARTDLYALGATLYELATGGPPFGVGDPVRILHDLLTRAPPPPTTVNPAVPPGFCTIVMHLLEKDPDDRYQSADALLHDLDRLRRGHPVTRPGERDLAARPLVPSRLAGRDQEIADLRAVFDDALAGRCSGLAISGPPGVGKTSLVAQLRPIVAAHGGWFVSGKYDEYRRDQDYDGVRQALRAAGRMLLAEPEESLVEVRERLVRGLGPGAGLAAAVLPEVGTLVGVPPDPGDPLTAPTRAKHAVIEVLRAIACRRRPMVFFVDDLQWAARTPLSIVDAVFSCEATIEGLLLVCAYRDGEVDATHPLTPMLARWGAQPIGPRQLRVGDLPERAQADLVADLLGLDAAPAAELAGLIAPTTRGNPYDTLELLAALRHDGLLVLGDDGWRWDRAAVHARLDRVDVTGLLAAHVAALPPATRELLAVMACLAGQVALDLLSAATGLAATEVERRLAPALAAGLANLAPSGQRAVSFHHDRVRESVLTALSEPDRRATRLRLARCLATRPEYATAAAQQYLPVADDVHDSDERRRMGRFFRRAADEARLLGTYPLVERFLTAAVPLVDPADLDEVIAVHTERHAALHCLGRLEEADEEFEVIGRLCACPAQRTAAVVTQIVSLTSRSRGAEAMRLGLDQLRGLGIAVPDRDRLDEEIDRGLDALGRWLDTTADKNSDESSRDTADGTSDETPDDPVVDDNDGEPGALGPLGPAGSARLGAARIVNRLMPAAFFDDQRMMAWLTVQTLQLWARDGPDPDLLGPASHIPYVIINRRRDYATAYRMMRRLLAAAEAGSRDLPGFEREIWEARFIYVVSTGHWFDTLEENVAEARRVLEGLTQISNLQNACWTHYVLLFNLLDCAPTLTEFAAEVDEAMAIATRTGNRHAEETFRSCAQLVRVLAGEAAEPAPGEATQLRLLAANPHAAAHLHITRALAAALLGRPADLARHTAAVFPYAPAIEANYTMAVTRVLHALVLAGQARAAAEHERARPLAELDELIAWLCARSADAPTNFRHLLHLAAAERAWAVDDFREAAYLFDLALRECPPRTRPWHRGLILERTARFYLAHGMEIAGSVLLAAARRQYRDWGATAKLRQLDWAHPSLPVGTAPATRPPREPANRRSTVTAGAIDLLGIVAASQALSSETSFEGLRLRLTAILLEMTGATGVRVLVLGQERPGWLVPVGAGAVISLRAAGRRRLTPSSVVRYVERTREPLVVADATRDDRFHRDPYFAGLDRCSLLAVPILIRGELRAMLLLENRMIREAFSVEHLEGIMLIAGQLTVSLDNALVYASLEQKVAERTQQLAEANKRLEQLSITDPLTGLANRRRLEDVLGSHWERATDQSAPLAVAMIDIDHFKRYNDRYGHSAGDRCLQRVAACLTDTIDDTQLAARYGGEEFAIVMPNTDTGAAARLACRLRAAIMDLAEPNPSAREQVVTASIGVAAAVPGTGNSPADLVERADAALYRAKRAGRDRVEVAGPDRAPRVPPHGTAGRHH
ncbi:MULTISPECIES: diguanylate cyclase [Pseudofrankia]|uniref:diguanylate cyclase n=1 Tax=Pseudofrankia TaxID=2994363 RepID=UPI000234D65A|nr:MULTISPECIES: diguanylate cyclase [Pseudofrankia]OHV29490.1 serine/threonine protein kinase [Pseudofrankia sp. EUN1h]